MVAVGVGAEDRRDPSIADSTQDSLDMAPSVHIGTIHVLGIANAKPASSRAGVNHRNFVSAAYQPGLRASKSIRRRIGCQHAPHQRLMLLGFACVDAVGPVAHECYMVAELQRGNEKGASRVTRPLELRSNAGELASGKVPSWPLLQK